MTLIISIIKPYYYYSSYWNQPCRASADRDTQLVRRLQNTSETWHTSPLNTFWILLPPQWSVFPLNGTFRPIQVRTAASKNGSGMVPYWKSQRQHLLLASQASCWTVMAPLCGQSVALQCALVRGGIWTPFKRERGRNVSYILKTIHRNKTVSSRSASWCGWGEFGLWEGTIHDENVLN